MERIPTPEDLNRHYLNYTYSVKQQIPAITLIRYRELLDEFETFRKNNRILDVGCGRGWFLEEALKRGWEVYGTEFSDAAIRLCESVSIPVKKGALDASMFAGEYFDVVTSFEVIEHVNNPNEELEIISNILRSGGLFYSTTPNFNALQRYLLKTDYNIIEYPEHLSYYTAATLTKLAGQHNLHAHRVLTTGFSFARLRAIRSQSENKAVTVIHSDEGLREQLETKWYLKIFKSLANGLLTFTGTGEVLKGYFIKG